MRGINGYIVIKNVNMAQLGNWVHCNENPIHVLRFQELRCLSPNFHIHVSVSGLYISRIGPHIWLQQNRQTDPGNV
jgi:hypothetical protein